MRILIIGNDQYSRDPNIYYQEYAEYLSEAVQDDSYETGFTLLDDLVISVGDGEFSIIDSRTSRDVKDCNVIIIKGDALDVLQAVSVYAGLHKIKIINDYKGFRSNSKLQQAVQFFDAGLPVARTILANPAALAGVIPLGLEFPCILKATIASHGEDNYLVQSLQQAVDIVQQDASKVFVLQRFVPNDGDYRILMIGDEQLVIKRSAVGDSHLNNTSQGGKAVLAADGEVPKEILDGARQIAQKLDLTIAGVDALADKNTGEFYFLEVNINPQIKTGAFTEQKQQMLGRYLKSLLAA